VTTNTDFLSKSRQKLVAAIIFPVSYLGNKAIAIMGLRNISQCLVDRLIAFACMAYGRDFALADKAQLNG
jgi:hypothetical protein